MHMDETGQQMARTQLVQDALIDEGFEDFEVDAFHASPDGQQEFRHVIKVAVGVSDRGHIRLGAWGRRNRRVVPIPNCEVATNGLRHVMKVLAHYVIAMEIQPYDPIADRGVLRSVILRQSRTTGEIMVTMIAGQRVGALWDLAEQVAQEATEIAGVWLHVNSSKGNSIFLPDEEGRVRFHGMLGKDSIEEKLLDTRYLIGPGDFFQTNPGMAEVLYQRTLERLELKQGDALVDLYCGVGGIALQGAAVTGWALGVESVESAVVLARKAARLNRVTAEFHVGTVADVLAEQGKRIKSTHPVVCVNPARRGLEDGVVQQILALNPSRVAYISCNPRALARDLMAFVNGGLTLQGVELFDMFPQTSHVECVAFLQREDQDGGDDAPASRAPRRKRLRTKGKK